MAWAKPKVALTPFDGDAGGDVRDAVAQALDSKDLSVIANRDVNRAVEKLGAGPELAEKDLKRLATDLEVDAIVTAKLDKAGATRTLKFKLFVHKKVVKGFTVSFKDVKSEKFRSALRDKIVEKIATTPVDEEDRLARKKPGEDDARAASKPAEAATPRPADDANKPAATVAPAAPAPADATAMAIPNDEAARKGTKQVAVAGSGPAPAASVAARAEPVRGVNRAAVRLDVGVSLMQRSFAFNQAEGSAAKDTTLSAAPGVRVQTEIYPLVLLRPDSRLVGLGLGIEFDKALGLNVTPSSMQGTTAPVDQTNFSIGLRYRYAFGTSPTSATLTAGVGFGKRGFTPDRSQLQGQAASDVARDTPEIDYTMIDPGVGFRYPVTGRVALSLAARGMLITGAGPIQDAASYGPATVYGAEVVAAAEYLFARRFVARLAGEFTQIGYTFDGGGALSTGVAGLYDRSLGGTATVAVVY